MALVGGNPSGAFLIGILSIMENHYNKFRNRTQAGQLLARKLHSYANQRGLLILALPRGGVPVAHEVAKELNAELDICLVRKLGVPGHRELAMGAIASGGIKELNTNIINTERISKRAIDEVLEEETRELSRRELAYRGNRPLVNIKGRTVILVDDGMATGVTMRAAVKLLKIQGPAKLVVAVPVTHPSVYFNLKILVDEVVCLVMPEEFYSIGLWYEDFAQTTDEEVCQLLNNPNVLSQ
jgi:putative phosphoribosyl transferase